MTALLRRGALGGLRRVHALLERLDRAETFLRGECLVARRGPQVHERDVAVAVGDVLHHELAFGLGALALTEPGVQALQALQRRLGRGFDLAGVGVERLLLGGGGSGLAVGVERLERLVLAGAGLLLGGGGGRRVVLGQGSLPSPPAVRERRDPGIDWFPSWEPSRAGQMNKLIKHYIIYYNYCQ